MKRITRLTESDLHRIIKNTVNRIIKESIKGFNRDKAVPEELAKRYGFRPEYRDYDGEYELWGKRLEPGTDENELMRKLGISRWDTYNVNGHVRITVKPKPRGFYGGHTEYVGDYKNSGYGDEYGTFFHNPKNGHVKRIKTDYLW